MKLHDLLPRIKPFSSTGIDLYCAEYATEFNINKVIYEGEYKTLPRQDVLHKIISSLKLSIYPDSIEPNNILIQLLPHHIDILPKLLQLVDVCGWFVSSIETNTNHYFKGATPSIITTFVKSTYNDAIITLEPKHSDEFKTPKFLYHVTPLSTWISKIKQYGLSPKAKSTQSLHPERVYVTTTVELAIALIPQLATAALHNAEQQTYDVSKFNPTEKYKKWAVLGIDTTLIPNTRRLSYFRVHVDHNTDSLNQHVGLYTQNYIPPNVIKLIKIINAY